MTTELNLIERCATGDSEALEMLVNKYMPMISNCFREYHIKLYDVDDWIQEARIVCFKACKAYDVATNSTFGALFKSSYRNKMRSILREQLAFKRQSNLSNTYLDSFEEQDLIADNFKELISKNGEKALDISVFLDRLSELERAIFMASVNTDYKLPKLDQQKIRNASSRCKYKFKEYLRENI